MFRCPCVFVHEVPFLPELWHAVRKFVVTSGQGPHGELFPLGLVWVRQGGADLDILVLFPLARDSSLFVELKDISFSLYGTQHIGDEGVCAIHEVSVSRLPGGEPVSELP